MLQSKFAKTNRIMYLIVKLETQFCDWTGSAVSKKLCTTCKSKMVKILTSKTQLHKNITLTKLKILKLDSSEYNF